MKDEYLESLLEIIKSKKNDDPKLSYTALLHSKGLKEILEKVHENKNEIGPLLENLNIVLKEVKSLTKKLNRMPILDSKKRKEEMLNFEIDN